MPANVPAQKCVNRDISPLSVGGCSTGKVISSAFPQHSEMRRGRYFEGYILVHAGDITMFSVNMQF